MCEHINECMYENNLKHANLQFYPTLAFIARAWLVPLGEKHNLLFSMSCSTLNSYLDSKIPKLIMDGREI